MRVLILASDIYTRGGIARYTATLARALGGLLGPENVDVLPVLGDTGPRFTAAGYRILEPTTNKLTFPKKLVHCARALWHSRVRYELVLCSHLGLSPIATLLKKLYDTPYMVACYGVEAWRKFPLQVKVAVDHADLVLPMSNFTRQMLCAINGVPPYKMRVLYAAIPDHFAGQLLAGRGGRAAANSNGEQKTLLSVGNLDRLHRYKGFETVIRALPRILKVVPNLRYVIVGRGNDWPYLENLAVDMGVADRVTHAGEVTDRELAAYYQTCDVFVLPSRATQRDGYWDGEGFGLVYVEAALAGKPVVGSRGGGAAEAVLHGLTGLLVDPTSVTGVAEAIITLLKYPELASNMGREGREWALQNFTLDNMRTSLRSILAPYGLDRDS